MFGFGGFNNLGFPNMSARGGTFQTVYRCYSVSMMSDRPDVERGGKIIMPPSALDQLTQQNIQYPMLFKLKNTKADRTSHCGVLEFVADEGKVYMPYWMMENLCLAEGDLLEVSSASLPLATFAKFQPQSVNFLDISNPRAVLETNLRNVACLTTGDIISLDYNDTKYQFLVMETKPNDAVSIIECDMNVDFAPPVGYQEPRPVAPTSSTPIHDELAEKERASVEAAVAEALAAVKKSQFEVFSGIGQRLDGKTRKKKLLVSESVDGSSDMQQASVRGVPDYSYRKGKITFIRYNSQRPKAVEAEENALFQAFSGGGHSLRQKRL